MMVSVTHESMESCAGASGQVKQVARQSGKGPGKAVVDLPSFGNNMLVT